jgi:hypothetical protein
MSCAAHPLVDETRVCTSCEQRWCDGCVRTVTFNGRAVCPTCGHQVRWAAAPKTLGSLGLDLFARVISREGLATAIAFALTFALAKMFVFVIVLYLAAFVGYYFTIVAHVGEGKPGLPSPAEAIDDLGSTVTQAVRGFLCAMLGVLPILVWIGTTHRRGLVQSDLPTVLVLLALAQLYVPAALMSLLFTNHTLALFSPVTWVKVISRAPLAYAKFLGFWLPSVGAGGLLLMIAASLDNGSMLFAFVAATLWNLYGFAQAVLIGDFVRLNSESFAWSG